MEKPAKTLHNINSLIAQRWSPRAFDLTKQISREIILTICEAAQWSPSSAGEEPWRFIIYDYYHNKESWETVQNLMDPYNKIWTVNAPVMISVCAALNWRKDPSKPNNHAEYDTGSSTMAIYLQALEYGIYCHPMAGFDSNQLKSSFNIPDDVKPISIIAMGYPGELNVLDEFNQKREVAERKRRPLESMFFDSAWGNPIK